jgi:hypothetical protein
VSSGTGSCRFRPREVGGSTRAGQKAGGEGEEASGRWDLGGVERLWRISAGGTVVGLVVARKKKGRNSKKEGLGSGFIGEHHTVEERERESRCGARLRLMSGAVVHLGHAWRPLSTGGPAWQGEREPAEAARAVGGVAMRHVARERAALGQQSLGRMAGEGGRVAQRGNRGAVAGGRRRGLSCDFPKVQGPHCNVLITFKP